MIDLFPTLTDLAGVTLKGKVKAQVEGRSLVPLLKEPEAPWAERNLVTHTGRWGGMIPGTPPQKFIKNGCAIRNNRYSLVRGEKDWQLFDLKQDPDQSDDIAARQPDVVEQLSTAYDQWWAEVLPDLENEDAYKTAPNINPFKQDYWNQFGGAPQPSTHDN
jgi:arylsulfatase